MKTVNQTQTKIKTRYKPPIVQILKHIKKKCSEYVSPFVNPDFVDIVELDGVGGWATVTKHYYIDYTSGKVEFRKPEEEFPKLMYDLLVSDYVTKFEIIDDKGRKWEIEYRYLNGGIKRYGSFDAGYIIAKHDDYIYIVSAYKGY